MAEPPFRVSHVVLDVDGTLIDFVGGQRRALEAALARCSELSGAVVSAREANEVRRRVAADPGWRGRPPAELRRESFRRLLAEAGVGDEAAVAAVAELFSRTQREQTTVYADVRETLEALRALDLTLIAASNGTIELDPFGLDGYFAATQFAPEAGVSKPDTRFFSEAVERAGGTPAAAAAVGDRLDHDYEPARAAGLHAVLIDRDEAVSDPSVLRIGALTELPALLEPIAAAC